jgi:aquaporin NIP
VGAITTKMRIQALAAETVATYILVFSGTGAAIVNQDTGGALSPLGVSLVFGLSVMAMIYAVGDISGAHLNPAVTIALWTRRKFPTNEVTPYIFCQLTGAVFASATLRRMFPENALLGATEPSGSPFRAFALESILSFILILVILKVTDADAAKKSLAGIVIGGAVCFEALLGGSISGASMNPARSFGPAILTGRTSWLWIYVFAPLLGAALASAFHRFVLQREETS